MGTTDKKRKVPVVQIFEGIEVEAVFDDEKTTSQISGIAIQTLRNDRSLRRGLNYIKSNRKVLYFRPDVYRHMYQRRIVTSDAK